MIQRNLRKTHHLLDYIFHTLQISVAFKNFGLFTRYKNKLRSEEITICTTGIVPFTQKQTCLTGFTGTLIISPYTISFSLKQHRLQQNKWALPEHIKPNFIRILG